MLLIKALLKDHPALRTMSFTTQRAAIDTLSSFTDGDIADTARKNTANQEAAFWFEVAHVLLLNQYREKKKNMNTPALFVQAFLSVMRVMKAAERTLNSLFQGALAKARRHPYWETLASGHDKIVWSQDSCGLPAMVRAVAVEGKSIAATRDKANDARDLEEAEKHIARTIGEVNYASDSGSGPGTGTDKGACGFCHELRRENMIDETGAERVCRKVKCRDIEAVEAVEADIKSTFDLEAATRSQIEFARGIFMQIIIEQSRPTSSPFSLLNFEMVTPVIKSLEGTYIDADEARSATKLLSEHERRVSDFVKGIMHRNVAVYPSDSDAANEHKRRSSSVIKRADDKGNRVIEVRLDTPRKWVGAILHFLGLFLAFESELSAALNQALTKDRACGEPDEAGKCDAPCTPSATETQKGILGKLSSKLNPKKGAKPTCEYKQHLEAESRKKDVGRIWSACGLRGGIRVKA